MLRPQAHFKAYSKPAPRHSFLNSSAVIIAVNSVISLVLIGLVIACPPASRWISEAVQAELAGIAMPEPTPTKIAQPALQTHVVRND